MVYKIIKSKENTIKPKECNVPKYCTIEPKLEYCTKEEFNDFIKNYPNEMQEDFYMDAYSYNDFTLGYWPYSMVAMVFPAWSEDEEDEFKIAKNYREVLASIKEDKNDK